MAKRDPVIDPAPNSSGSPRNASAGRVFSIKGGGAAFSKGSDKNSSPIPSSPYGK